MTRRPADRDRSRHLDALHGTWATPPDVVADVARDVARSPVADIRRVVAGEQNEVYDVTFKGAPSLIVRIARRGAEAHEREAWVLDQCAAHGIPAPRLLLRTLLEESDEEHSVVVLEKLPGERLSDVNLDARTARRVLGELGGWLAQLHSIPVEGCGYLDGAGTARFATLDDWLAGLSAEEPAFVAAGHSAEVPVATIQAWLQEIVEAFRAAPPRVALIHNDLLADNVLVHDGHLSGVIDFGEVAAEPAASDFAKWDFVDGERFPVEWIQDGYGDPSLFEPPNDRTYRALRLAVGLWRMRWYHETGFQPRVDSARDRLLSHS